MGRCVWDGLAGQDDALRYLKTSAASGKVSHAYLFLGPSGSGKKTFAKAFAAAVVCQDGGCGDCPACWRILHATHPDVRIVRPEGAASYLVAQVREIVRDVNMRPIEANRKFYVIENADAFSQESGNAFLKTLEEPPEDVVIVLLAEDYDAVLPTIASRCQIVRFKALPLSDAVASVMAQTGVAETEAAGALAAAGGVVPRAVDFASSAARRETRDAVLGILADLASMDAAEVLAAASRLMQLVRADLESLKAAQSAELKDRIEFLGPGGSVVKEAEERHKRELTSREREGLAEVMNVAESWLADCLRTGQGAGDLSANRDVADETEALAQVLSPEAATRALDAVRQARKRISYNVNAQLALEAMLFDIQEVLKCPR